ncbi:MAG: hypothetical protein J7M21_06005 [Planctomycetes bacterium]|nr:hypothetical protein [Planctomycetota bacterium]
MLEKVTAMKNHVFLLLCAAMCMPAGGPAAGAGGAGETVTIVSPGGAGPAESLAAREIRRYVYLRTGRLLPIAGRTPAGGDVIFVADRSRCGRWASAAASLKPQQYILKTVNDGGRTVVLVVGGDAVGTLYGAYRFAEHLGVRFYLHGDVVPDRRCELALPELDDCGRPLFALRGIQPFHDFPEGPDWWNAETYKAVLAQLAKMRMNFIGLHTYPAGRVGPEPTVWIGLPSDVGAGGRVKFSYPARHFTTLGGTWGYAPRKTSDYSFGTSQLFERDAYGADYMKGMSPWPKTPADCNELFDRVGAMLRDVFSFARRLGIKTCIGTEVPLTVPPALKARLHAAGRDSSDPDVRRRLYEGIFTRIMKTHPLDYYWFWTPEGWTWRGASKELVDATLADIRAAIAAARTVKAPFTLATCGWVLGPPSDRALFDGVLPKDMPISCINRQVGFAPVEEGFARVKGRGKWAIPWMEDDPGLIIPQLWVGRTRRDAADSLAYGCTGLMGIHWRTRILGPNLSALARAAWDQRPWNPQFGTKAPASTGSKPPAGRTRSRDLPAGDFYADWAASQFGPGAAREIAAIFTRLDSGSGGKGRQARLPRPATWVGGPGGIKPDTRKWQDVVGQYAFVDELAKLRGRIEGAGNLERFDYWLNNFRYLRAVARLRCAWGAKADAKTLAAALGEVHRYLLAAVSTPGGLGTIANWQQHIIGRIMGKLKLDLPKTYTGPPRLIVPTARTSLLAGEGLKLKVIILGGPPSEAGLYWRKMGRGEFNRVPLEHVARGVYSVKLRPGELKDDVEYYVEAKTGGRTLRFPATAPALNQTVVIMPAD